MVKNDIYIINRGNLGDLEKGWGYTIFWGDGDINHSCACINHTFIKKSGKHFHLYEILNEFSILDKSKRHLFRIENLTNTQKADEIAYEKIKEIANGILLNVFKPDAGVKIIDKTEKEKKS